MNDLNPWAPPVYNGIMDTSPEGFKDEDFTYAADITIGTNQIAVYTLQTDKDCDFVWRGIVALQLGDFPAAFRFSDGQGYFFLCDQFIYSGQLQGDGASPFPWPGELIIPAGTQLRIETNLLGDRGRTSNFELQLRGVKRRLLPS